MKSKSPDNSRQNRHGLTAAVRVVRRRIHADSRPFYRSKRLELAGLLERRVVDVRITEGHFSPYRVPANRAELKSVEIGNPHEQHLNTDTGD